MSKKAQELDQDLAQSKVALLRARERARELAAQTQTPLVTYGDGKVQKTMVVRESPKKMR